MKIHLFTPCIVQEFYPETAEATRKILEYLGHEVYVPKNQTCCGQPAYNSGYTQETIEIASYWLDRFSDADCIVGPSGSCISMVKNHYGNLDLPDSAKTIHQTLSGKYFELVEFLVQHEKITSLPSTFKGKVSYHQSCHLANEMGIIDEPRDLLKSIPGIEYIEMKDADRCCGFGGTFSVKFSELSATMTRFKAERIIESGAEFLTGGDISCLMNIDGMLKKMGASVKVLHIADILAEGL